MKRRSFIANGAKVAVAWSVLPAWMRQTYPDHRPPLAQRKFISQSVEACIASFQQKVKDPEWRWLFSNCFPNTLDTTVFYKEEKGRPDSFVITGDIDAMWLRDSTAQVWPYLSLLKQDEPLRKMVAGLVNRQTACILIDPYANAFNHGAEGGGWQSDLTAMKPELHERKWELDSLCYAIRLAHGYVTATGDITVLDEQWLKAAELMVQTMRTQQRKTGKGPYRFQRQTANPSDTVPGNGYGNPIRPIGLIASIFRPSDDATVFPFLIPSNFFAVASLRQLADLLQQAHPHAKSLAQDCRVLAREVEMALQAYAIYPHPIYGKVYAFEIDGFGNHLLMDDANAPSLLSLPYLGAIDVRDPIYQNTRSMILAATANPYFFGSGKMEGMGSPHTPLGYVWPIGITMQALTATNEQELSDCLWRLKRCHAGTGFMHESFDPANPKQFTRSWFAWANTLFGELLWKTAMQTPGLLV